MAGGSLKSVESVQPLNVAGAMLLVQIILLALMAVTVSLCDRSTSGRMDDSLGWRDRGTGARSPSLAWLVLVLALISITVLVCSADVSKLWGPLFDGVGINVISTAGAMNTVFGVDIVFVAILMAYTGRSADSPFTGCLFTLPALAIFLRATPWAFLTFAVISGLLYLALSAEVDSDLATKKRSLAGASRFMNIACLALSMLTGYITRPVPIDQLHIP